MESAEFMIKFATDMIKSNWANRYATNVSHVQEDKHSTNLQTAVIVKGKIQD
jgi:hypothetical protein